MENEITMKGSVRPYRFVSRLHVASVLYLVTILILVFLMTLSLLVGGQPVIAIGPLLGLLAGTIGTIRSVKKPSKTEPRFFAASPAGIEFTGTDAVMDWNQVKWWSRKRKGILVILKSHPFRRPLSFPNRVLSHDNGFAFLLKPDTGQKNKDTVYAGFVHLLDQNTKNRKETGRDHV